MPIKYDGNLFHAVNMSNIRFITLVKESKLTYIMGGFTGIVNNKKAFPPVRKKIN